MKISNRLEAYLSWISTGVKPEDFDDEPRNMTEYWLQGEANRLDRMSGNKSSVAIRSLKKGAGDEKYDYADLENKPIQPYIEGDELVENKYYFTLPEVRHPQKDDEISYETLKNLDQEALIADIPNFTYEGSQGLEFIVAAYEGSETIPFLYAARGNFMEEENEDIIRACLLYPVYASKHKNSSYLDPSAETQFYYDENGWIYQIGDIPITYQGLIEQFKENIQSGPIYYVSGHCDDAFEIVTPTNIFQYVDGEQKSVIAEGEGRSAALYDHQVKIAVGTDEQIFVQVLNSSSDAFTISSLHDYLNNIGQYPASGWYNGNLINAVQATDYSSQDTVGIVYFDGSYQQQTWIDPSTSINDNIIKL